MASPEYKSFASPDDVLQPPLARGEALDIGGGTVGRYTPQPGWRWSEHIKSSVGTELCEAPHFQYQVSGRIGVRMADGTEFEVGPGKSA